MTRGQRLAHRFRWALLSAAVLCWVLALAWVLAPLLGFDGLGLLASPFAFFSLAFDDDIQAYAADCLFWLGCIVLMQWLFLHPSRGWRPRLTTIGRPMRSSVIAAAFAACLLTAGAVLIFVEVAPRLDPWGERWLDLTGLIGLYIPLLIVWVMWTIVFWLYWRKGDRYEQLSRMVRWILRASYVEAAVGVGVFAWNPRNESCYCARGSYMALITCGTVMLWAFGPGLVLLFLREHYRREKLAGAACCPQCGYDLRGTRAANRTQCPECGTPFLIPS